MNSEFNSLFIQQLKQKKKIVCSTEEINTRNTRIKDLVEEILLLTEGYEHIQIALTSSIVSELIAKIRESIGVLYKVSESIALMDILMSFATVVTLNSDYGMHYYSSDALVRPNFTTEGPIAIKQGRHPILEKSSNAGYFVPVRPVCDHINYL
jgi:DNA mismatch repair protein MSH4